VLPNLPWQAVALSPLTWNEPPTNPRLISLIVDTPRVRLCQKPFWSGCANAFEGGTEPSPEDVVTKQHTLCKTY